MNKFFSIFSLTISLFLQGMPLLAQKPAIGTWRDHLPYGNVKKVAYAGDRIYAGGDQCLYYLDREDGSVNRMSTVQGFSDVGVSQLAYNKKKNTLVIVYQNSNIDLLIKDDVYNISDLKRKSISTSKEVYDITFEGNNAYLSCHFGIVVLDLDRKEIKDIYIIGKNSGYIKVNSVAFNDTSIFAATEKGLLYAGKNNPLLANFQNWKYIQDPLFYKKMVDEQDSLIGKDTLEVTDVKTIQNQLVVSLQTEKKDIQAYYYTKGNGDWTLLDSFPKITSQIVKNQLFIINSNAIVAFDENMNRTNTIEENEHCSFTVDDASVGDDNSVWLAQSWYGLFYFRNIALNDGSCFYSIYPPNSPSFEQAYRMTHANGKMYTVPGGRSQTQVNRFFYGNMNTYSDNSWKSLNDYSRLDTLLDFIQMTVDPLDKDHAYIASYFSGIVEVKDNAIVQVHNDYNTNGIIQRFYYDSAWQVILIAGIGFDTEGNLWAVNSRQNNVLLVRTKDGQWKNISTASYMSNSQVVMGLTVSRYTPFKWFWTYQNQLFVHDGKNKYGWFSPNYGNDLESSFIFCVVEDQKGLLWIGTDHGIKNLNGMADIFQNQQSNGQLTVPITTKTKEENDDTRYLLENASVTCIAVDGANRKWVGTQSSGVFFFSENFEDQLLKFTEENSPLFSNTIQDISINQATGEVFFITEKGIISYMGDAIEGKDYFSDVYAYPNPVKPDYHGPIAIKGLAKDALVHITDIAGNTVFTTQANGGQAVWNGNSLSGKRVTTGVYLVFAADKQGEQRTVTKILFIK